MAREDRHVSIGRQSAAAPENASENEATLAIGQDDAPTSSTQRPDEQSSTESSAAGLSATRVGTPDPDDAVQRGLRAFRRSAGRSKDAADAVYGRIQRV